MIDITAPQRVEVEIQNRPNGKVIYVHVDGVTFFRACQVHDFEIILPEESENGQGSN